MFFHTLRTEKFVNSIEGGAMSKFVDPRSISRTKTLPSQGEAEIVSAAEGYIAEQKLKSVKWFTCHGLALPTDDDIATLITKREADKAAVERNRREQDRKRTLNAAGEGCAAVPRTSHPLHSADTDHQPNYAALPANGLSGRRAAFAHIERLCRIVMLRNRLDTRLQRINKAMRQGAASDLSSSVELPRLKLLDLPLLHGSSESFESNTATFKEAPSVAELRLFSRKELRVPFEFKNKGYTPLRFSDHPFANADLPEEAPVLFAGAEEVPAGCTEGQQKSSSGPLVPAVDHFVQPIVTLETFPMPAFAYATHLPWQHTIQSQFPQRITDGGFRPPHVSSSKSRLSSTQILHCDPMANEVFRRPLPQLLTAPKEEDQMSDDDEEVALPYDAAVLTIDSIRSWAPVADTKIPLQPVLATRHAAENDSVSARRATMAATFTKLRDELPLDVHLLL